MCLVSLEEFVLLLVSLVQVVLEDLVVLIHQKVQGVFHHQEALHHQGVLHLHQGVLLLDIFYSYKDILLQGALYQISSSVRGSPTFVWISPSFRRCPISLWSSIIIITISSWIISPSWHGSPLHICAFSGGSSFC